jgi:methylglyoxal synthase
LPCSLTKIALVAHDNKSATWWNGQIQHRDLLAHHKGVCHRYDGHHSRRSAGFRDHAPAKRPFGGDQQIGAKIVDNEIDFLIFFWDPLEPMPHDPDVKALLRMAVVWNIPIACNRSSADFMISSPLMDGEYDRLVPDYTDYRARPILVNEETPQEPPLFPEESSNSADPSLIDI